MRHSDRMVRKWLAHARVHIGKPPPAVYPYGWLYTNQYDVTIVLPVDIPYTGK
jgi:hypothetical protein